MALIADSSGDVPRLSCQCSVRVPDGRVGTVVGYYRRTAESVLVRFAATGSCEEFLASVVVALP